MGLHLSALGVGCTYVHINMNPQTNTHADNDFLIHPATRIGLVCLAHANLGNQILFYEKVLGFKHHWRMGHQAGLGAGGADLVRVVEEANLNIYRGTMGL